MRPESGRLEADDGGQPLRLLLVALGGGQVAAEAVVARGLLAARLLGPHLLQPLGGAVAAVDEALLQQLAGGALVVLQTLRLEVGAVGAADLGAFVPVEAEPAEPFEDGIEGAGHEAGLVGVFDAQDELSALMTGEEPVEEGGADVADVGHAGRAGSETDANSHLLSQVTGGNAHPAEGGHQRHRRQGDRREHAR